MKNYFQSGLALGLKTGACDACNIDFSWLFKTPSNLLWIDKIVITKNVWDLMMKEQIQPIGKAAKLSYQLLNDIGMVKIISDNEINQEFSNKIFEQIDEDVDLIKIKKGVGKTKYENFTKIGRYNYCAPRLWKLYASILLSYEYNSSFNLDNSEYAYLKTLLKIKYDLKYGKAKNSSLLTNVLSVLIPQSNIWPEYLFANKNKCKECINFKECNDGYLNRIEKNLTALINLKEKEEIRQLCEVLEDINEENFKKGMDTEPKDVLHDIRVKALNVQKKINKAFKRVDRWTKITGIISGALSLGAFFNHPEISPFGAIGLFASNTAKEIKEIYKTKYQWVNYITSNECGRNI